MISDPETTQTTELMPEQRRELLRLARRAITHYLHTGELLVYETDDPPLLRPAAVFVTLRLRADRYGPERDVFPEIGPLRGCIGQLDAEEPLHLAVATAAIHAATRDPRFRPVRPDELEDLVIDISVLSPFRPIHDLDEIVIGRDGLYVIGRGGRGLLLPDVAVMFGLGPRAFVRATLDKAHLPDHAWPSQATLLAFSTEKLSELDDDCDSLLTKSD